MSSPHAPQTPPQQDSSAYLNRVSRLKQFVATAAVLSAYGWAKEGNAKVLRERVHLADANGDAPPPVDAHLIVAGIALEYKCYVGPLGTYSAKWNDPLHKAKSAFLLGCPYKDPLMKDAWMKGMENMHKFEACVCDGKSANLFHQDDQYGECLRFTRHIFSKKGDAPEEVDTSCWPVGTEHAERLKETAKTHNAQPFPLYDVKDDVVPVLQVERVLPGSLVEVSFRLICHCFPREGTIIESMTAEVAQVLILKKAPPRAPTPFSARRGVFRPAPTLDASGVLMGGLNRASPVSDASSAWTRDPNSPSPAPPRRPASPGGMPPPPELPPAPAPPQFAAHLQPEGSPYGSHQFFFAHPGGPPPAPPLLQHPRQPMAPPPMPQAPPPPPPFGAHLNPESSPYGTHPFAYAYPAVTGVQPFPERTFGPAGHLLADRNGFAQSRTVPTPPPTAQVNGQSDLGSHQIARSPPLFPRFPRAHDSAALGPARFASGLGGPPFGFLSPGAASLSATRSWPTGDPNISTSQTSGLLGSPFPRDYQAGSFPGTAPSTTTTEPAAVASPTPVGARQSPPASPPRTNLPASYRGAIPSLDPRGEGPPRTPSRAEVPSRPPTPFNTPNSAPTTPMEPTVTYMIDEGSMTSTSAFRGAPDVTWHGIYAPSPAQFTPGARSHSPAASDNSLFGDEYVIVNATEGDLFSGNEKRKLDEAEDDRPRKRAGKEVEVGSQGDHE
ncbi:hypothetical protein B0H11DRAFT_2249301 [Mycena galericulata]|nr:hypothetical protein B0H11DRAFT_2249301 [Mycena galericulata]